MLHHKFTTLTTAVLAACCQFTGAVHGQQINVVVPAEINAPPSRDAHFNWVFESASGGNVQVGQFACGSYWVAPAVGDNAVKLLSLTGNPLWTDYLSCDADPIMENHGLLNGGNSYGSHDGGENLLANLPATIVPPPGSCVSLVAAMQRNEAETSAGGTSAIEGEVADAYCVVTVLAEAPPNGGADMIRPNITGATKEFLTWDDFDLNRIPSYAFLSGYSTAEWEDVRVRWAHSIEIFGGFAVETAPGEWNTFSEGGRAFRAHILIDDYASGMASSFNNDLLALFSQDTPTEKEAALAAMLAFANDLYHARYDYGASQPKSWTSGAGQHAGKILPVSLLAALQVDESKAHQLRKVAIYNHGDDPALLGPQELRQIPRGMTGVHLWGDGYPIYRIGNNVAEADRRYWAGLRDSSCYDSALGTCNPAIGKKTAIDPYLYHDGPANKPGTSYMSIAIGTVRGLAAAMILMPEIRSVVNTDAPIEFVDRIERHGLWTYPDPVAAVSITDQLDSDCDPWRWGQGCQEYGVTWGPDPVDVRFAIEDGVGRFVNLDGAAANSSYESPRALYNWNTIIGYYDGNTFEDTKVPLGQVAAPDLFFETGAQPKAHLMSNHPTAEIRYTLDGSAPTASSTLYTGPVSVSQGTIVSARAFVAGKTQSPITVEEFGGTGSNPPPTGRIEEIEAETADQEIWDTGGAKWQGQQNMRIGGSGSSVDAAAVFPFELPVLNAGEAITGASLYLNLEQISGSPLSVLDLYGIDYRSSSTVDAQADYYEGVFGSDPAASAVDDSFATAYSQPGELSTDATGSSNLVAFLNAQYAAGAQAGDFVFLRLNSSLADEGNYNYWLFTSSDSPNQQQRPLLALEISDNVDTDPPSVPSNLAVAAAGPNSVELSWSASGDNTGVVSYKVYTDAANPVGAVGLNAVIPGLDPSTTYSFTVTALDAAANESDASSPVSPTTSTGVTWLDIPPETTDQEIWDTGGAKWVGQHNIRIGGAGSSTDASGVFPFELPQLNAGESITAASFAVNLEGIENTPTGALDLYGLPYRTSAAVVPGSDYFEGAYGADSSATPIDDAFAVAGSGTGQLATDAAGESNLASYLNGEYATGALAGDYVFLRLNPNIADETGYRYWTVSSADATDPADHPLLSIGIAAPADVQPPSAPSSLASSSVGADSVTLQWNTATDDVGVAGYIIYRDGGNPLFTTGTSATVLGLHPSTSYTFTASAYDSAGNESASSTGLQVLTAAQ